MNRTVTAILIFGGLVACATFLVGSLVQAEKNKSVEEAVPDFVEEVLLSPEWKALEEAKVKGPDGYEEIQDLMDHSNGGVANNAAQHLINVGSPEAIRMVFEKLPTLSSQNKNYFRSGGYTDYAFRQAMEIIADREDQYMDGALLFLRLPYEPFFINDDLSHKIGDTLVAAIPDSEGDFADNLAFTIGRFHPTDLEGLRTHLRTGDRQTREIAVAALGKLEDEDGLDDVVRMKSDSSSSVRAAAQAAEKSIKNAIALAAATAPPVTEWVDPLLKQQEARKKGKKKIGMP